MKVLGAKMRLSTWGMWEQERKKLADALRSYCGNIDDILLEEAISKVITTIREYYATTKPPVMMDSYKLGFEQIRDVIHDAVQLTSQGSDIQKKINQQIDVAIAAILEKAEKYFPYTSQVNQASVQIRAKVFTKLYGSDFPHNALIQQIKVHDPAISAQTVAEVSAWMGEHPPSSVGMSDEELQNHLLYMKEIGEQLQPVADIEEAFQNITGISMQEYKGWVEKVSAQTSLTGMPLSGYDAVKRAFAERLVAAKEATPASSLKI